MPHSKLERATRLFDPLMLIMAVFTVTFFVYRDFGIRMLLGFGVLLLILGVHVLRRLAHNRPLTPVSLDGAFILLALVLFVNFLRPDSRHDADSLSYMIAMIICTGFVCFHSPEARETRRTLTTLLAAACAMAVFSLVFTRFQSAFYTVIYPGLSQIAKHYLDHYLAKGYGIALGGYTFADYVLFGGIAVCFGCLVLPQKPVWRVLELGCMAVFLFVILSLGRRGELLGTLVCCFLLLLLLCSRRQRLAIILGSFGLAAVALWLFFQNLPVLREIPMFRRYVFTIEAMINGWDFTSGRMALFALAIKGFCSAPLFGIGFDQFHTLVGPTQTDFEGNVLQDAHNIYLQMLCETGIVGTILTLLPIGYLFATTCRMLHHAKTQKNKYPLCLVIVSFLIQSYLLFLGLYDPTFQKIVFWCFYGVAIMLLHAAMSESGWHPGDPVTRLLEKFLTLCAPVCMAIWNWAAGFFARLRKG